jgi:hypothetical protein
MKSYMEDTFGEPPSKNFEEKFSLSSTQKNFFKPSNIRSHMGSFHSSFKSTSNQSQTPPDMLLKGTSVTLTNAKPLLTKSMHPECFQTNKKKKANPYLTSKSIKNFESAKSLPRNSMAFASE